jgi:sialidase-1
VPDVRRPTPTDRRWVMLLAGLALVGASLVAPPLGQSAQAAQTCTSVPFTSSKKAHRWYRVPSVVSTGGGRVIAFAERRDRPTGDEGNFDIVMRVSTDRGCHWGSLRVVSNNGSRRVSNPVPVFDQGAGQVLLFTTVLGYNAKTGGYITTLHEQRMNPDGSAVTALSAGLVSPEGMVGRAMGNCGPGHAVVLSHGSHAGRIIVPLSRRDSTGTYILYAVYSDDHGASWRVGYSQSVGKRALIEGSLAEVPNGNVVATYREKNSKAATAKPGRNRVIARSSDGGETVTPFTTMAGVRTVPVFGSLLTASSLLLFSSPDNVNTKNLSSRRGMRLFVSSDSGATWHASRRIGARTDSAGYSDLVQLDDRTVGILYENGYSGGWKQIRFTQTPLSGLS